MLRMFYILTCFNHIHNFIPDLSAVDWYHLLCLAEKQQKEVWSSRLQKWLYERFGVYIEDFRFQPEESTVETEEPLSAKRWV